MLRTLINREVERLSRRGYESVVVSDEIVVDGKKKVVSLGCDSAILTGVFFDDDQMVNNEMITVSSATSCISANADRVASMGENIHKVMRQYISIHRSTDDLNPVVINIVKVCPKKR